MLQLPANTGFIGSLAALLGANNTAAQSPLSAADSKQLLPGEADFAALMRDLLSNTTTQSAEPGKVFSASEELLEKLSGLLGSEVEMKSVRRIAGWAVVETELPEEANSQGLDALLLTLPLQEETGTAERKTEGQTVHTPIAILVDPRGAEDPSAIQGLFLGPMVQRPSSEVPATGSPGEVDAGTHSSSPAVLPSLSDGHQTETSGILLVFHTDGSAKIGTNQDTSVGVYGISSASSPVEEIPQSLAIQEESPSPAKRPLFAAPVNDPPSLDKVPATVLVSGGDARSESAGFSSSPSPQAEETPARQMGALQDSLTRPGSTPRPIVVVEGAGTPEESPKETNGLPRIESPAPVAPVSVSETGRSGPMTAMQGSTQPLETLNGSFVPSSPPGAKSNEAAPGFLEPGWGVPRQTTPERGGFGLPDLKIPSEVATILRQALRSSSQLEPGLSEESSRSKELARPATKSVTAQTTATESQVLETKPPGEGPSLKNGDVPKTALNTAAQTQPERANPATKPSVQVLLGGVAAQMRELAGEILSVKARAPEEGQTAITRAAGGDLLQKVPAKEAESPSPRMFSSSVTKIPVKSSQNQPEISSSDTIAKPSGQAAKISAQPAKSENVVLTREGSGGGFETKDVSESILRKSLASLESKPGAAGYAKVASGIESLFDNGGTQESLPVITRAKTVKQPVAEKPISEQLPPDAPSEDVRETGTRRTTTDVGVRQPREMAGDARSAVPRSDTAAKQAPPSAAVSPVGDVVNAASSTTRAGGSPVAESTPPSLETQVVEQVTRAVRVQNTQQGSEIRIRLVPENLGEVHVKIAMEKGTLVAEFRPSTEIAREILARQAYQIQAVLEGSGIQAERVVVRTAGAGTEDHGGNPLSQRENSSQQSREQGPGQDQRGRGQQSQSGDDKEGKERSPWDRWERFA